MTDLAEAHVSALNLLLNGGANTFVNLATSKGHSVREVIATVEKISRRKVPTREAERRAGDPPHLVADARKASSLLGWNPLYSDLETIIETA